MAVLQTAAFPFRHCTELGKGGWICPSDLVVQSHALSWLSYSLAAFSGVDAPSGKCDRSKWSGWQVTILRPQASRACALPTELQPVVIRSGQEGSNLPPRVQSADSAAELCPELARTGGLEPPFATPITVRRFVAGVGYVRVIVKAGAFEALNGAATGT